MLEIKNVNKYFNKGHRNEIHVINDTSLTLPDYGLIALLGPSGSGKTTLLNVIGGLDRIKSGSIYINNEKISSRSIRKVDRIRSLNIGYIFQDYKLLDDLTVYENIAISLRTIGVKDKQEIDKRITYILDVLKMKRYKRRPCSMLSGGERQRVGIARALIKNPEIILADEPTGNLDSKNSLEIMKIIKAISREKLVILVTHENDLAHFFADRIILIQDGKVEKDYLNNHQESLNYQMENTIYLKDFKHHDKFKEENYNINIYSDIKPKIKINLIIRNGNIYIENLNNEKIEVVEENSNIDIIDDHYKEYTKKECNSYEFNLDKEINLKGKNNYSSIFKLFNFISAGYHKILSFSLLKKMLLIGFFISSMFVMLVYSRIFAILDIRDEDFVKINRDYLIITMNNTKIDDYLNYEKVKDIDYIIPGNSIVNFRVSYPEYYQTTKVGDQFNASLSSINLIKSEELIDGRMPNDEYEVILDVFALKQMFQNNYAKMSGILSYKDMLNHKISISNMNNFTIVGLVSKNSPSIYMSESLFSNVIANCLIKDVKFVDYNLAKDKIVLKKGHLPEKDYEVILNVDEEDRYILNKEADIKINNKKLKVVGFYTSKEMINYYFVNNNTIKYNNIVNINNFVIKANNKANVLNIMHLNNVNINDSYAKSRTDYINKMKEGMTSSIVAMVIILFISLVEIFLMIRSSFLSRIKEIGILRAIGVKKLDIYKMFFGEIFAISTFTSIPGILVMAYLLKKISSIHFFTRLITINSYDVIFSIITILIFNTIVGLLPVYKTIKYRPSEILSRNDLD